ncbi:ABC transporter substrate-binding protein, partial [Xanthomonas citri pv. citri]|nr:ABC transporter substrate-binding protein [Xanthomonas citri pv. citri]
DFAPLAREGIQVLYRDPYAVSYLGLNQRVRAFQDLDVRRAVAAAIDRGSLAKSLYPNGTNVADQFVPARFNVNGDNLQ